MSVAIATAAAAQYQKTPSPAGGCIHENAIHFLVLQEKRR